MKKLLLAVVLCVAATGCGSGNRSSSPTGPSPTPSPSPNPTPTPTPTPTPLPAGIVFRDTFTANVREPLVSHVPDRGGRWVLNEDTTGGMALFAVQPGMDWLSPADLSSARMSFYVNLTTPLAGADYFIEATLDNQANGSSDDFAYFMLRPTDPGTYYGAGWYASAVPNDCYIFKVISGVYTQLANGDCNFTGDNTQNASVIRFAVQGDTLTLFKDGASILSAPGGNAITATGAAGVGAGNIRNPTDDVAGALALDDLSIGEIR